MRFGTLIGAAVVVGALVTSLFAARFTTHLDPLETLLETRVADTSLAAKRKKLYQQSLRKLGRTTTSLKKEIALARAVIQPIEKKAADDTEVIDAANAAVEGLASDVADLLAQVNADADPLRTTAKGTNGIFRQLQQSQALLDRAIVSSSLFRRLTLLRSAFNKASAAQKAVAKALNGGGGGGGGGVCGPSPTPDGLRKLKTGESATATFQTFNGPIQVDGDAFLADVGKFTIGGYPYAGATFSANMRVRVIDCQTKGGFEVLVPFPPTVDQEYQSGQVPDNGTGFGLQSDYDGLTQVFPGAGSVRVKATAFNESAKTMTLEVTVLGLNATTPGVIVLKDWRDLR